MSSTGNKRKRKFLIIFWGIIIVPLVALVVLFTLIAYGRFGFMPTFEELENPKSTLATEVLSEEGKLFGKYFYGNQNRTYVYFDELSPNLVNALIATEDVRFYRHSGIDMRSLMRVMVRTVLLRDQSSGGGSTLSQQLAKLLFHERPDNIFERVKQKLNEWVIAIKLEKSYTKEEILTMYLNQIDFLHNAVGIQSASMVYFNKMPDELNLEEAAMLVGMVKNPSIFNPLRREEKTMHRRNVVLRQMQKYDYITEEVFDSVAALPLKLDYQRVDHNQGLATYFREYLRTLMNYKEPAKKRYNSYIYYKQDSLDWATNPLFGWCNKNTKPDGTPYDLYRDGLRIYTTLNYKMQKYAEEAVEEHLSQDLQPIFNKEKRGYRHAPFSRDLTTAEINQIMESAMRRSERYLTLRRAGASLDSIRKTFDTPVEMRVFSWRGEIDTVMTPWDSIRYYKHFLHAGMMSMDPKTGYVKAYVGGNNYKHFQYDHVKLAKRQAGSTFKPFLYILAMQEGTSPCQEVPVVEQSFIVGDSVWVPRSTVKRETIGQYRSLKWGLANSENYVSAWLLKRFAPEAIVDIAHSMGIESYIDPVPSMIYGVSDVTVYEMVGAFSTFANKGMHTEPIFVSRIEDRYGNVLATFTPDKDEAISEHTAYLMLNLMQGVVNRGTAIRLRYEYEFTGEIAGKTGTTQNHSDGWFIGITPKLVSGVWVGAEDRSVHFDYISHGQGAYMALPIWAKYMQKVYKDSTLNITQEDIFEIPENIHVSIDCEGEDYNESSGSDYEFSAD